MNSKRVLLVEDELVVALDTEDFLKQAGYTVVGPVASLKDAVVSASQADVEGAVLDVNLNGDAVWPAATRLAERGIPFVFLTAFGTGLELPEDLQDVPVLDKPLNDRIFLSTLKAMLNPT